jgi:hypothetical protein
LAAALGLCLRLKASGLIKTDTLKLLYFDYNHLLSDDWTWEEYRKITESLPDRDGWELEELGSE